MKSARPNGYTVLELMIVIAVSATMFVAVSIAFGGRQQQIQFTQSVRALDARIQDLMNDISSGYYDNAGNIECTIGATRPEPDGTSGTPDTQGKSDECVFIGKAIQFAPKTSDVTLASQPDVINVYNIIGRRNNDTNGAANSLEEARPVAVAPVVDTDPLSLDDEVSKIPLDWGLKITDIEDSAGEVYGTIGFFTSFSKSFSNGAATDNISNNQLVRYGGIQNTSLDESPYTAVDMINSITDNISAVLPDRYVDLTGTESITICVKSADDRRRAAIVIGGNGTTTTQIKFDDFDGGICVS